MLKDVLKDRPGVDIVKLHKSGGVVNRNSKYRSRTRVLKTKVHLFFPITSSDKLYDLTVILM